MPVKVRVTASQGPPGRGPVPPLIYKAEAFEAEDQFREPVWTCGHEHHTVEAALRCGEAWLDGQAGPIPETA